MRPDLKFLTKLTVRTLTFSDTGEARALVVDADGVEYELVVSKRQAPPRAKEPTPVQDVAPVPQGAKLQVHTPLNGHRAPAPHATTRRIAEVAAMIAALGRLPEFMNDRDDLCMVSGVILNEANAEEIAREVVAASRNDKQGRAARIKLLLRAKEKRWPNLRVVQ